ncbi:MAG: peptidylprolyl isomerase, partial [Planctomycetaceae bacterium]
MSRVALCLIAVLAQPAEPDSSRVLVRVNGTPITQGDLELALLARRVPADLRPSLRGRMLEQLVEWQLVREYLADRKAEPSPEALDAQVERVLESLKANGQDPEQTLSALGYTRENLKRELALPLAWQTHVRRVVTQQVLRDYFADHRAELDGTEVRASHIVIKVPADAPPADWDAAERKLADLRTQILAGNLTFEQAAKQHSEGPSATDGGDVGFYPFRGKMPAAFADATFPLQVGEITKPFRTPFGVHLAKITDRREGQFSLEDVRNVVLNRLSQQLWDETVTRLRQKARIER